LTIENKIGHTATIQESTMNRTRFFTILSFIFIAMMSRFLPHPPNFTAINAVALFSIFTLGNVALSLIVIFTSMFLTDLVFGLHTQMIFVYLSLGLTVFLGRIPCKLPFKLIASSILFFIIVNFGVWLSDGLYPNTLGGLKLCYIAGLPFLANQLMGDFCYAIALFGLFSLSEKIFPSIDEPSMTG
jgi:hypothetical protein